MVSKKHKKELNMVEDTGLSFIAMKDHIIKSNAIYMEFKKGIKYSNIPSRWETTLKTEKVIMEEN